MAFERYEIISPKASELMQLIEQHRQTPHQAGLPRVTILARKLGIVPSDEIVTDVQLLGVLYGENNGSHIYGEIGNNPVSTADIAISDAPDFPAVMTITVPDRIEDIGAI